MKIPTVDAVIAEMRRRGHVVFDGLRQPDLNLVGLRATPGTLDAFDDLVICFHRHPQGADGWMFRAWTATLDPGKPIIENPTRRDGTAVMAEGQTRGAYRMGSHHVGRPDAYPALVPRIPIPVVRYTSAADYAAGRGARSTSSSVNIHRASAVRTSTVVGPWSEGCAVFAAKSDHDELMSLCRAQVAAGLGDSFTWTVMGWPS